MEHDGVIQKYTITIDPAAVGLPFCAFIRIGTAGERGCDTIAADLSANPEIEECHSIAGRGHPPGQSANAQPDCTRAFDQKDSINSRNCHDSHHCSVDVSLRARDSNPVAGKLTPSPLQLLPCSFAVPRRNFAALFQPRHFDQSVWISAMMLAMGYT
jgi:hypothetical protein